VERAEKEREKKRSTVMGPVVDLPANAKAVPELALYAERLREEDLQDGRGEEDEVEP